MFWTEKPTLRAARSHARARLAPPWLPLTRRQAAPLDRRLRHEAGAGHPLRGAIWSAVGRDAGSDDVLFAAADGRAALVHLAWREESSGTGPHATLQDSLAAALDAIAGERAAIAGEADPWAPPAAPAAAPGACAPPAGHRCSACGADWSAGEAGAGCRACGGHAMQRPCPSCGGTCGAVWQRAALDSNDAGEAVWIGRCAAG